MSRGSERSVVDGPDGGFQLGSSHGATLGSTSRSSSCPFKPPARLRDLDALSETGASSG